MQINVFGAERRRRYDEKVRLVEETLQAGGWLIACCSPAVDKRARGDWAEMLGLVLFPPRSRL
jgi:hypothetical protein